MIKLAVSGAKGRMGTRISALAFADKEVKVNVLLEHAQHPGLGETINGVEVSAENSRIKDADVLIEFTLPEGTLKNLEACMKHKIPMVIGTTGFDQAGIEAIHQAAEQIPIVFASNMSVGVNLLFSLVQRTGSVTGKDYRIRIEETHHVHKKDAPSGTAKTIAELAEQSSAHKVEDIQSFREGEVIGDHTITFESDVDVITISHSAKTRDIFAQGAIHAAKWLANQPNGLYSMQKVLGLE